MLPSYPSSFARWIAACLCAVALLSTRDTIAQFPVPVTAMSNGAYQRPIAPPIQRQASPPPYALRFDGRYASVPVTFPRPILHAVYAANTLQGKPYRMGGGHKQLYDSAYDCSGSVSYILFHSGLLRGPLNSTALASYGMPGPGRFITVWVRPGEHAFLTICGLRFDTTGGREGEGPRWRPKPRSTAGFITRHPPGL